MADEQERRGRRRGAYSKLRRYTNIDNVVIEEPFTFELPSDTPTAIKSEAGITNGDNIGDAYYISSTVGSNRRYYGVLVDQTALKAATLLHFRNEAKSVNLTRRIKALSEHQTDLSDGKPSADKSVGQKRPLCATTDSKTTKRAKVEATGTAPTRPIQKFRYVSGEEANDPTGFGHRILLATFVDAMAAADDDEQKAETIEKACQSGGQFVGRYYYAYEVSPTALKSVKTTKVTDRDGMRTSMGFQHFLLDTALPIWYPLSNLQINQHRIFSMLNMKRDTKGGVTYDAAATAATDVSKSVSLVPMIPRTHYRVVVVGGGIAGLSCAKELFRLADATKIKLEVMIVEGRKRLGGRLVTDFTTFKFDDGSSFPCDLGASWIHGIDHNPLAALAKDSGAEFVTASEQVRMLREKMKPVAKDVDERMGQLLDDLLDEAADDAWDYEDFVSEENRHQTVVRWYGSCLSPSHSNSSVSPPLRDVPPHRKSSDVSIDHAIARAIKKHNHKEFASFGPIENALLHWNTKNIEYALGANVSDLSMKFWDSDERHAFEGDHVLLRQGYGTVVKHLVTELTGRGDMFNCILDYNVEKIEYARTSSSIPFASSGTRKLVELSDTCSVSSRNGKDNVVCDFVVSTLPLGVLKASTSADVDDVPNDPTSAGHVTFVPKLPFTKIDSIENTGFGVLNKVYLQFPRPFWRSKSIQEEGQTLFGNASGLNPHHYMFFDIGKSLGRDDGCPAVLMTLISGKEAVASEKLTDTQLVHEVISTLRKLFFDDMVPHPVAHKVTRWGSDRFARGCYVFLPPGATDQDFNSLQSPINGNGDSIVLEGSETMRLFWAGEHTTALHPSMAHGAMLSGMRAAKDVLQTIQFNYHDGRKGFDKLIPLSIFREKNPNAPLQCYLCHKKGTTVREGSLLCFQRGARLVLVHNNCGEYSPEVEVRDGKWKDIVKAVNRGKQIVCSICRKVGASVGCAAVDCFRSFHFGCAQDVGWRFERDGKEFFCDLHRRYENYSESECDQISLSHWRSKVSPKASLQCVFCHKIGDDWSLGSILAFQHREDRLLVHDKCARFTNIMETVEDPRMVHDTDFNNLFEVLRRSKTCSLCSMSGATVLCTDPSCDKHFHVACAQRSKWDFARKGLHYKCAKHRQQKVHATTGEVSIRRLEPTQQSLAQSSQPDDSGNFQHALFSIAPAQRPSNTAVNSNMGGSRQFDSRSHRKESYSDESDISISNSSHNGHMKLRLSPPSTENRWRVVELRRKNLLSSWGFALLLRQADNGSATVCIDFGEDSAADTEAAVSSIDGMTVGSEGLQNLQEIIALLRSQKSLTFGVRAKEKFFVPGHLQVPSQSDQNSKGNVDNEEKSRDLNRKEPFTGHETEMQHKEISDATFLQRETEMKLASVDGHDEEGNSTSRLEGETVCSVDRSLLLDHTEILSQPSSDGSNTSMKDSVFPVGWRHNHDIPPGPETGVEESLPATGHQLLRSEERSETQHSWQN